MLARHKPIFEPITIGKVRIRNRVALAPTYVGMGDDRGNVTDQALCYYYARASGGVGLIIVELTAITGRYAFSPGKGLGLTSNRHIPGFQDLARVIHWGGAKAIVQLFLGHGAQAIKGNEKRPIVGPSDIPAPLQRDGLPKTIYGLREKEPDRPRPLTVEEIQGLKSLMIDAAIRAKRAGFDGIELHGAHGYLLGQFTSPYFNQRNDDYGGTPEKRWRLSIEIIKEIKEKLGDSFIVGYRFSAREWIPGGMELPESIEMAKAIEDAGADYLSVSHGCYGSITKVFPKEEGAILEDASCVKKEVSIPVMCPNFLSPDRVADALKDGYVDMVALSRALLADPLWVRKVKEGRAEEIRTCIRCYQCVRAAIVDYDAVRCSINPMLGFERFDPSFFPRPGGN